MLYLNHQIFCKKINFFFRLLFSLSIGSFCLLASAETFSEYSRTKTNNGSICRVGIFKSDTDPQKAVVIKANKKSRITWKRVIQLHDKTYYQNRATHCIEAGGNYYILEQADTQSTKNTNQTILYIVKFTKRGIQKKVQPVYLPESLGKVWSLWVELDKDNFRLSDDRSHFILNGKFLTSSDASEIKAFSTDIKLF